MYRVFRTSDQPLSATSRSSASPVPLTERAPSSCGVHIDTWRCGGYTLEKNSTVSSQNLHVPRFVCAQSICLYVHNWYLGFHYNTVPLCAAYRRTGRRVVGGDISNQNGPPLKPPPHPSYAFNLQSVDYQVSTGYMLCILHVTYEVSMM